MKQIIVGTALLLAVSTAGAQATRPYLTAADALTGVRACHSLAQQNGWNVAMVIVDRGQRVIASLRMDGALSAAYTGATLKAETALSWFSSTDKVAEIVAQKPEFKQLPGLLPIGGGEPIFSADNQLTGAIGVAGSAIENDRKCAQAVVAAIKQ